MPRQEAYPGQRTTTEDLNEASRQVVQDYETVGDRNAAFGSEDIPDTIITTIAAPATEARRWERRNAADTDWEEAFLPPALNGGWDRHRVITNRSNDVTIAAEFVLNQAVPVSSGEYRVNWRTVDGTATVAEGDYEEATGEIAISPGVSSASVTVKVLGKGSTPGPPETFYIELYDPSEGNITFALGARMRVDLTGDQSPLTLAIADGSGNEGDKITNRVTASREATGNITFEYSTAVGLTNPAPNSVYTQISGATGTIPEGNTFVDLTNQSNNVNADVFIADETYRVVINPLTLRVDGGDVFALTGHDLTATNTITRDQVVTPNIFVEAQRYSSVANRNANIYVADSRNTTGALIEGTRYPGRSQYNGAWPPTTADTTTSGNANSRPLLVLRGALSAASAVDAHFFVRVRNLLVYTRYTNIVFRQFWPLSTRSARVDVARGDTSWHAIITFIPTISDRTYFLTRGTSGPANQFYPNSNNSWEGLLPWNTGRPSQWPLGSPVLTAQIQFYNPDGLKLRSTAWQNLDWS